jgi:beta-phosphoglucomutase-like phosphatase (HAD superfamily)
MSRLQTAFLFDLDGTLVDSVYQHMLSRREAWTRRGFRSPCGASTMLDHIDEVGGWR